MLYLLRQVTVIFSLKDKYIYVTIVRSDMKYLTSFISKILRV